MTPRIAALRALLPWPTQPSPTIAEGGFITHPQRLAATLAARPEGPATVWEAPHIPGRPELALALGGVPLALVMERELALKAAEQLQARAPATAVLLVAVGADGLRLGTPARDPKVHPSDWPLASPEAAARALQPERLRERLRLAASDERGLLHPIAEVDVEASLLAMQALADRRDALAPMANPATVALGLSRAGSPPLLLTASPAETEAALRLLRGLGVSATPVHLPQAGAVRVGTAAEATKAPPAAAPVIAWKPDRRHETLRALGWGPWIQLG